MIFSPSGAGQTHLQLLPATEQHLAFARDLTRRAMLPYFVRYGLLWQDPGFDEAWQTRENHVVSRSGQALGYLSLRVHCNALYLLELHLLDQHRGQGVGGWALEQVLTMARQRDLPRVRLMVFKANPAQALYQRHGFVVVGEEESYRLMQYDIAVIGE